MSDHFGNIPIQPPESTPPTKKPPKKPARTLSTPKTRRETRNRRKIAPPQKKYLWPVIIVATLLACLYCGLGFLGVPYYVDKVLPNQFHDRTGMELVPSTVTFNPFTFRFETGPLRVLSESGTTIMSLQSIYANLAPVSFLRLNLVCNSIVLDKLDLNIARELDGSFNFQQIFGDKKNSTPSELFNLSNLPFFFSLNNISITNSSIKFIDAPAGKTHTIEKIQLDLPSFSTIPFQTDQYLRPHFSAIVNGSPIEMTGQAVMGEAEGENQMTKLSLDVHDLDLTIYAGYLPFSLPMEFKKGMANGKIDLLFDPHSKTTDKLSIDFQLQISEAQLDKQGEAIVLLIPTARLEGNLQPVSKILHLTDFAVKDPTISSFGKSFLDNINKSEHQTAQTAQVDSTEAASYKVVIDLFQVDDGSLHIFPQKNDQQPSSSWKALQLTIKNFSSAKKSGSFNLSGEKDGSLSDFSWQGTFSETETMTGSLNVTKMDSGDLFKIIDPDFPLSLKGLADLKGQLTLSSKDDLPSKLSYKLGDTEISIENFALIEKEKSVLTSPFVKIAPLNVTSESLSFGTIYLQKATAQVTYNTTPEFFSTFNRKKYQLQGIDFEGKITLNPEDKSGKPITFTEVSLKVSELDNAQKSPNNLSVAGKTETGGIFKAQGKATLSPFSMAIKTGFSDLPLINVLPFFTNSPSFTDITANLSGKGLFKLPNKSFTGELQLTKAIVTGGQKGDFSWQKASLQDLNYTAKPFHLTINSAKIDQAHFSWDITKDSNDPMQYLSDFCQKYFPKVKEQTADKPGSTKSPVDIQEISFANSKVDIHDSRLTPAWQAEVVDLSGQIKDIHSAASDGKSSFSFAGKLDESPFTIDGAMDPFARKNNGSLHFSLKSYPLAAFHKQLASKTDLDTSKGDLKMTLNSTWQNQQYVSSGTLELINPKAVSASSAAALPLALLTGTDDTLKLDFDFSRTEPVGKTALVDELLATLQKQLIKGIISPLLLAKGDFTDLIDHNYIEFQPGEFMIAKGGREILSRYIALLEAHPRLGLVLSGGIDQNIDRIAMQKNLTIMEQQRVEKENEKLFKKWQEQKALYQKKLEERQKTAGTNGTILELDIPAEILTGFKPLRPVPIKVDDAMLLELAQNRINIVYEYFTKQVSLQPERISRAVPKSLAEESESPSNGVIVTLKAID